MRRKILQVGGSKRMERRRKANKIKYKLNRRHNKKSIRDQNLNIKWIR